MLKATLRSAVLLGLLAWSVPSFAEVQNVKVGGEVNVRTFLRKSLRLSEDVINGVGTETTVIDAGTELASGEDNFLQQLTAVNIGADLTENVSTNLRLINQRVWGSVAADATDATDADANQVEVSLANLTLKELFYSPLTVTIGRQRLWFGRGFIVGSRLLHADVDASGALAADEYSDLTAFDAIRGTLDLSGLAGGMPLTLDGVYAKVDENVVSSADDVNLVGANLGTRFDQWNGEVETYFWNKRNDDVDVAGPGPTPALGFDDDLESDPHANTLGLRGSVSPMEGTTVWAETAYQWGRRIISSSASNDSEGAANDGYQAWAANLGLDWTGQDVAWSPTIGGEWIFFSGDNGNTTAIAGWDPVYRGAFTSAIREFQAPPFYMPAQSGAGGGGAQGTYNLITSSVTNQHQLALHATVRPLEDLSVDNRLTWFIADVGIVPVAGAKRESGFGTEWDVQANYSYTDDVQLGLIYALFNPGSVFRTPYDDTAQQLVTSVSVKF